MIIINGIKSFSELALLVHCFQVELEFKMLVFVEGGNRRTRRKTFGTRKRTNEKLNLHVTPGP